MNVFLAGIHGVGKSYLAEQVAPFVGMVHTSASQLIKEQQTQSNWTHDKKVSDVAGNQIRLINAVRRHNDAGTKLLIDGHFVLIESGGQLTCVGTEVFSELNLEKVVLLEAPPHLVAQRIQDRDQRNMDLSQICELHAVEHRHAEDVCAALKLPLIILQTPTRDELISAITSFCGN